MKECTHYHTCLLQFKGWKSWTCQREECPNAGETSEVVKLSLDHRIAIAQNGAESGLLVLCEDCAEEAKRLHPPTSTPQSLPFIDILLPLQQISILCDNKVFLYI